MHVVAHLFFVKFDLIGGIHGQDSDDFAESENRQQPDDNERDPRRHAPSIPSEEQKEKAKNASKQAEPQ
jgi:hypothetical protein